MLRVEDLFDAGLAHDMGGGLGLGFAERVSLRSAAAFGHGFGEVCEEHGEPEPERGLEIEAEVTLVMQAVGEEQDGGEDAADFDDEHGGVLHHDGGLEFDEGIDTCAAHDLRVGE
jgi:hypothetical protein